jgi:hypothetical protein
MDRQSLTYLDTLTAQSASISHALKYKSKQEHYRLGLYSVRHLGLGTVRNPNKQNAITQALPVHTLHAYWYLGAYNRISPRQSVVYTETSPYMGTDTPQTCRYSPLIAPPLHYHPTIRRMTLDYALTCLKNDIWRYNGYPIQVVAHAYAHNPLARYIHTSMPKGRGRGETALVPARVYHPVKCVVKNDQNPLFMAYLDHKLGMGTCHSCRDPIIAYRLYKELGIIAYNTYRLT